MQISVKFFGLARAKAGTQVAQLELPDGATYSDVVAELGRRFPGLINLVIDRDGRTLLSANMFSQDGEAVILPDQMDGHPRDGEHLMLMSIIVGGEDTI